MTTQQRKTRIKKEKDNISTNLQQLNITKTNQQHEIPNLWCAKFSKTLLVTSELVQLRYTVGFHATSCEDILCFYVQLLPKHFSWAGKFWENAFDIIHLYYT